jgi:hypothetical protein
LRPARRFPTRRLGGSYARLADYIRSTKQKMRETNDNAHRDNRAVPKVWERLVD